MLQKNSNSSIYVPKQSLLFQNSLGNNKNLANQNLVPILNNRLAVIEASAGTGKTFALVELVLELMFEQELPLSKILLVTFTEKATLELKNRLRKKFQNLLESFEKKEDSLKKIPDSPYWEINNTRKNLLKAALLDFESTQIYTIHGFCKRMLSEFAFENRQLFEQDYCDTNTLFQEVFSKHIRKKLLSKNTAISKLFSIYVKYNEGNLDKLREEILNLLNREGDFVPELPNFTDFIEDFTKFWESLVSKDLLLRTQGLDQHPILTAFEFTALNQTSKRKVFANLNFLLQTLADYISGVNIIEILPNFFEIELSSITKPKCRKELKHGEKWLNQKEFPEHLRLWMQALNNCEIFIKRNNIFGGTKKILKVWLIQNILGEISNKISKIKLERGLFDFDDLLRIVEQELFFINKKNKRLTPLTIAIREKYLCAIVDEFQDTDRRQWSIFNHLFLESSQHRLIVIGDPKQSIYSFRGADIFTYLEARKKILEKTSSLPFILKKNFRSSEKMIIGLNQIFSGEIFFPENRGIVYQNATCGNPNLELKDNSSNRKAIHLLKLNPKFIISSKKISIQKKKKIPSLSLNILEVLENLSEEIFYGENVFLKRLDSVLGKDIVLKNKVNLLNLFLDDRTKNANLRLADAISMEIKKILRIGESKNILPIWKEGDIERNISKNDICVLFRKNSEGELLAKSLKHHGIDFMFHKQKGLFYGREAVEILDLLQAIANPKDFSRIFKLFLTRFFEVDIKNLSKTDLINSKIFFLLKDWHYLAENRKFGKLFDIILNNTKLLERELFFGSDERSVTNYLHLFEFLNKKISQKNLDLFETIQLLKRYIEGQEDFGEEENFLRIESEREAIQLMTMHAAKGLEFPIVFLFGGLTGNKKNSANFYYNFDDRKHVIDLLNPKIPEKYKWQEEAEQNRLLYVSLTRARGRLYLPYIDFLSSESGRSIYKIRGPYLILNEVLSKIISKDFSKLKKNPFSISDANSSNLNQFINVPSSKKNKISEWNPTELIENSIFTKTKNNQKKLFDLIRFEKRGFAVSSFSKLKRKDNEMEGKNKFWNIKEFPLLQIYNEERLGKLKENDEVFENYLIGESDKDLVSSLIKNEEIQRKQLNNENEISGGVEMGSFLHKLLENLDFSSIRNSYSKEEWFYSPSVQKFFAKFNKNYGFPKKFFLPIAEIIWKTLRTKICLGENPETLFLELANIKEDLREVDFYFPFPKVEKFSDNFLIKKQFFTEGWNVGKGFLQGSIDLLFEYNDKIYFLDWKSNILEDYSSKSLRNFVFKHYELQFQIYTLATCYLFKINYEEKFKERFGGAIFIFLRGIENHSYNDNITTNINNNGVFFKKPSWEEFLFYEKKLFSMDI